uniref:Large ribosomal subunit protein bL9 C-terminal domain-containing protein n=1 Tax=Ipomoea trifida TaxID=35884 RepID=A0A8Y5_IPOTF|nr:hypothetical protein [Ipomoea trifida]
MKIEEERIEAEKKRVKEEAQQLALIFETVGGFKAVFPMVQLVVLHGGWYAVGTGLLTGLFTYYSCFSYREVDKRIVSLPEIRETGAYTAELKLHPEVTARVQVIVSAN